MRISDWSSDVFSSDLHPAKRQQPQGDYGEDGHQRPGAVCHDCSAAGAAPASVAGISATLLQGSAWDAVAARAASIVAVSTAGLSLPHSVRMKVRTAAICASFNCVPKPGMAPL